IEKHEIVLTVPEHNKRIGGGAAAGHLIAGAFQAIADQQGNVIVIFDDKEPQDFRHGVWVTPQQGSGARLMVNRVPRPSSDSTRTRPPQRSTIWRTIMSPRALPGSGQGLPEKNSCISCRRSAARPRPVSAIQNSRHAASVAPISMRTGCP